MRQFILFLLLLVVLCSSLSGQAYPDRHSTNVFDGWLSCETSEAPNPQRGIAHWIMYDLSDTYALHEATLWNINHPEYLNAGLREMFIDYSIDGVSWVELGRYTLSRGPASSFYQGEKGLDFEGVVARYVLITARNNYGHNCYGLSEIKINAIPATTSEVVEISSNIQLKAYPNPFTDWLMVEFSELPEGQVSYRLSDNQGRLIQSMPISTSSFRINGRDLAQGMYFLQILHNGDSKTISVEIMR
jgi:hypothetical protein